MAGHGQGGAIYPSDLQKILLIILDSVLTSWMQIICLIFYCSWHWLGTPWDAWSSSQIARSCRTGCKESRINPGWSLSRRRSLSPRHTRHRTRTRGEGSIRYSLRMLRSAQPQRWFPCGQWRILACTCTYQPSMLCCECRFLVLEPLGSGVWLSSAPLYHSRTYSGLGWWWWKTV